MTDQYVNHSALVAEHLNLPVAREVNLSESFLGDVVPEEGKVSKVIMNPLTYAEVFRSRSESKYKLETRRIVLAQGVMGYFRGAEVIQNLNVPRSKVLVMGATPEVVGITESAS